MEEEEEEQDEYESELKVAFPGVDFSVSVYHCNFTLDILNPGPR